MIIGHIIILFLKQHNFAITRLRGYICKLQSTITTGQPPYIVSQNASGVVLMNMHCVSTCSEQVGPFLIMYKAADSAVLGIRDHTYKCCNTNSYPTCGWSHWIKPGHEHFNSYTVAQNSAHLVTSEWQLSNETIQYWITAYLQRPPHWPGRDGPSRQITSIETSVLLPGICGLISCRWCFKTSSIQYSKQLPPSPRLTYDACMSSINATWTQSCKWRWCMFSSNIPLTGYIIWN